MFWYLSSHKKAIKSCHCTASLSILKKSPSELKFYPFMPRCKVSAFNKIKQRWKKLHEKISLLDMRLKTLKEFKLFSFTCDSLIQGPFAQYPCQYLFLKCDSKKGYKAVK